MTFNQPNPADEFDGLEPNKTDITNEQFSDVTEDGQLIQTAIVMPENFAVYSHAVNSDRTPLTNLQKALGHIPNCVYKSTDTQYSVYRLLDPRDRAKLEYVTPLGADLLGINAEIPLPDNDTGKAYELILSNRNDIVTIASDDIVEAAKDLGVAWPPPPKPHPLVQGLPLERYSLQGKADELAKQAVSAAPLLGEVCRSGQATVWYAPPNSGKTLIGLALAVRAVHEGRILGGNVYLVNADDNSAGIAEKLRILDDLGAHTLVPGFNGFKPQHLRPMMIEMAEKNKASGVLMIIDTVKPFANLMDKRDVSEFASACRHFVARGGTILIFAHTNKNKTADGFLKYAGTTDLIEQLDAAYVIAAIEGEHAPDQKIVRFKCEKRRGDSPDVTAYTYSTENGLSYDQLLASVEEATFDKVGELERDFDERSDAEIITAIKACVGEGINTKMQIASTVAKRTNTSGKGVIRILERYTGDSPRDHHWGFTIGERGKHIFRVLTATDPDSDEAG